MGQFQVVFSPHSGRDLEQIVRYISRDNPDAAIRLGLKLVDRTLKLTEPVIATAGSNVQKRPGIQKLIEGNYLIFYRIFPDQSMVRILRFWHAARNQKGLRLKV